MARRRSTPQPPPRPEGRDGECMAIVSEDLDAVVVTTCGMPRGWQPAPGYASGQSGYYSVYCGDEDWDEEPVAPDHIGQLRAAEAEGNKDDDGNLIGAPSKINLRWQTDTRYPDG